jgi:hypothetical protein
VERKKQVKAETARMAAVCEVRSLSQESIAFSNPKYLYTRLRVISDGGMD